MEDIRAGEESAFLVLDESLPVVHNALVSYYGFTDPEAEAFKDTLAVWFHRVIKRQPSRTLRPEELREQLLFVACKYARAFQLARSQNGLLIDNSMMGSLQVPAEEVALALLNHLQPANQTL